MTIDTEKANLISKLLNSSSDTNNDLLSALESFIEEYKKQRKIQSIPLNLFSNRKLGVLEVLSEFLIENQKLSYHEAAVLLNRDDRTIWSSYNKALKKHKEPFSVKSDDQMVDIGIFSNRDKAPLQALVHHLKDKGLSFKQIATVLNRDYKTIWLTYHKNEKNTKK